MMAPFHPLKWWYWGWFTPTGPSFWSIITSSLRDLQIFGGLNRCPLARSWFDFLSYWFWWSDWERYCIPVVVSWISKKCTHTHTYIYIYITFIYISLSLSLSLSPLSLSLSFSLFLSLSLSRSLSLALSVLIWGEIPCDSSFLKLKKALRRLTPWPTFQAPGIGTTVRTRCPLAAASAWPTACCRSNCSRRIWIKSPWGANQSIRIYVSMYLYASICIYLPDFASILALIWDPDHWCF